MPKLYTPREAAQVLGVSYASLKQWIYQGKLKSVQTPGGNHRISKSEIDRADASGFCQRQAGEDTSHVSAREWAKPVDRTNNRHKDQRIARPGHTCQSEISKSRPSSPRMRCGNCA